MPKGLRVLVYRVKFCPGPEVVGETQLSTGKQTGLESKP